MEKSTQIFKIIKCEKKGSQFIRLSVVLIGSVFRMGIKSSSVFGRM